jgi:hypothetical protein
MAPSFLDLCVQFPPNPTTITRAPFYTLLLRFFGQRRGEFNWREREGGETDGWMDERHGCVCVCVPRGFCPGSQSFRRIDRLASDGEEEDGGEDPVCSCVCWM